ncbi:MAG: hypothetical protein IIW93_07040, partial [Bacteroidaceae bacterium]|nr:hypothetical protein [Bacteroidaceae bacterium]
QSGNQLVGYSYDAWGNLLSTTGSSANTLGKYNPLRYRGYVYDQETNLYYLSTRYYNPDLGRFLNADNYPATGHGVLGNNMFAYCNNNPVIHKDSTGTALDTVFDVISLVASVVEVAKNPEDPWAWVGLAGDVIDVVVPFVGGVGETVKVLSATNKVANTVDAVDDAYDAARVLDKMESLCFVEGTLVCAEGGEITIEDIHTGDYVWAWDEETGTVGLKKVVETYINETDELVHVHVNGEEIITTPSHPFYSPVKGWIDAVHIRAGDILVLVNGEYVVVEKVQHEILETPIEVYNFQVEGYHTYYVGKIGILVHNSCSKNVNLTMPRVDAVKTGKEFLGDNYSKLGNGHYISEDGYRTMRFDLSHHDGTPAHINLERWKYKVEPGLRNKRQKNIHIFFDHY